jgi:hypothetical protein
MAEGTNAPTEMEEVRRMATALERFIVIKRGWKKNEWSL